MELYALYMTSHPRFMTSQHSIQFISLLYLISNWIYRTTHPLHLCIHTQIIDDITPIVCMITQAQYAWYHVNTYDITSTLYDITPRYDIHIHCIYVITPRIPVVASTVAELLSFCCYCSFIHSCIHSLESLVCARLCTWQWGSSYDLDRPEAKCLHEVYMLMREADK